jgi:hypothetical protein
MALIVVNLTDTFNDWRLKTNSQIAQVGDLATLTAQNSSSIVGALNGMMEELKDDTTPQLGGPLDLNSKDITGTGNLGTVGTPIVGNAQITGNAVLSGTVTATTFLGDLNGTINTATTAVTQAASNNSTKIATTAYVDAQVATENTLEEMDDTTISGLANLDVLQYDSSGGGSWKNRTMSAAGIPTTGFTVAMAIALG